MCVSKQEVDDVNSAPMEHFKTGHFPKKTFFCLPSHVTGKQNYTEPLNWVVEGSEVLYRLVLGIEGFLSLIPR